MNQISFFRPIVVLFGLLALTMLACGSLSNAQVEQAKEGAGTAAAIAQTSASQLATAGPTFQAGADELLDQAATMASQLATQAPTLQAQAGEVANMSATLVASGGSELIATVQASDLNLSSLQSLFNGVNADDNGNFTVTITEEQLNSAVALRQTESADQGEAPNVQNMQFTFTDGVILFTGEIVSPVEAPLTAKIVPYVDNGIKFSVTEVKVGSIQLPATIVSGAESALNSTIGSASGNLPANFVVNNVAVGNGVLTITGQRE